MLLHVFTNIYYTTLERALEIEQFLWVSVNVGKFYSYFNLLEYHFGKCQSSCCNIVESYVELFGQYVSPTKMSFELSRMQNGNHMNDAHLSLSFDDDERLLRGRAYMRPTLWNDIAANMRSENFASSRLSSELVHLRRLLAYDMRLKSRYLRQSVEEPVTAVVNYYTHEVSTKWRQLSSSFNRMYRANEFYMRDIHQALKRHFDDIRYIRIHVDTFLALWIKLSLSASICITVRICIHTYMHCLKKTILLTFDHNFGICRPSFKIFFHWPIPKETLCNYCSIFHLTLSLLRNSKI